MFSGQLAVGQKINPKKPSLPTKTTPAKNNEVGKIEILQADVAQYDTSFSEAHRLNGHVIFRHETMLLFCDSARFYEKESRIKAYGHIHVQQGDTLNVYGDSIDYMGKKKIAKLCGHVKMIERDMVLVSDSVHFDAKKSIGYYTNGATITSAKNKNTLVSRSGYYHSKTKDLYFRGDVQLKNPDLALTTDTLRYNLDNETAYFISPTKITTKDTGQILTSKGWFDTRKEKSGFYDRSILRKKSREITADTILYDQKKGLGTLYGGAWMYDTTQKTGLFGGYAFYDELNDKVLLAKKPYMFKKFNKDTLYLKADTISSVKDTADLSTIKAYHHVKLLKGTMMGSADSLVFSDHDSLLKFFYQPILWQDQNQLTGDYMQALVIENKIQNIEIKANSFIISKADTVGFNQIKGRNIYATFKDDEISKIKVEGNGQTIYYVGEKDKPYTAVNRADCSDIMIHLAKEKISKITFIYQPEATAFPLDKYPENEKYLKDFKWMEKEKPAPDQFETIIDYLKQKSKQ